MALCYRGKSARSPATGARRTASRLRYSGGGSSVTGVPRSSSIGQSLDGNSQINAGVRPRSQAKIATVAHVSDPGTGSRAFGPRLSRPPFKDESHALSAWERSRQPEPREHGIVEASHRADPI